MAKKLENIVIEEISLVTVPAIRKKFLIIKEDGKFFECLNCGATLKLKLIDHRNVNVDQLKCSKCDSKNIIPIGVVKMDELKELFKELIDEDFDEDQVKKADKLSDDAMKAVTDAFKVLNKYKADMPEDLLSAIKALGKYATGKYPYPYPYPAKKEDLESSLLEELKNSFKKELEDEIEKAGKKLSKDTVDAIKKIIATLDPIKEVITTLKGLISGGVEKIDQDAVGDSTKLQEDVNVKISEISNAVSEVTKKISTLTDEVKSSTSGIGERLDKLEKVKGIKKGIDDSGDEGDDKLKKDMKWPSFGFLDENAEE